MLDRPLDGFETLFRVAGHVVRLNVLVAARVRGPLDAKVLRGALDAVQRSQPMLRARVVDAPEGPRWAEGVPALPLDVVPRPGREAWVAVAERALDRRFDLAAGPLAAATLLQGEEGEHDVLVVFHHLIGDAGSSVPLMRDLLTAAAALAHGQAPALPLHAPQPSIRDLSPLPPGSSAARKAARRELLRMLLGAFHPPAALRPDAQAAHGERRTRIVPRGLVSAVTARLAARCRAEGTTVTGALGAALAIALAEERGAPSRFEVGIPVNMRPQAKVLDPEAFGFYALSVVAQPLARPGDALWPLAREVRGAIEAEIARGAPWGLLALVEANRQRTLQQGRAQAERRTERKRGTIALTNLGRVEAPQTLGPIEWETFHFAVSTDGAGVGIVLTATTFRGALRLNLVHPVPLVAPPRGDRIAERVVALLLDAAGS